MIKFLDEHFINFFKGISLPSISAFPDSNYLINICNFQYNDKYLKYHYKGKIRIILTFFSYHN